jgi:hypothetical protein
MGKGWVSGRAGERAAGRRVRQARPLRGALRAALTGPGVDGPAFPARLAPAMPRSHPSTARGGPALSARAGDPADFAGAFAYEHTDVPPGVTLTAWRQNRRPPRRRHALGALTARLRARRRARRRVPR